MTEIGGNGLFGALSPAAAEAAVRFAAAAGAVTRDPLVVAGDGSAAAFPLVRAAAAAVRSRGCPVLTAGALHAGAVRDLLTRRPLGGALMLFYPAPGRIGVVLFGADGRDADAARMAALWDAYDNGSAPGSPAAETALPVESVRADYLQTLAEGVDAAAIRAAKLGCAIDFGGPAAAALGDAFAAAFGLRLLRFRNDGGAAFRAAVQLDLAAAFGFTPGGEGLFVGGSMGEVMPAETAFALAIDSRCRRAGGGEAAILGGNGLLLEATLRRAGGRAAAFGEEREFYGADHGFAYGGAPGFDAFRMAALLLETAAASGRKLAELAHNLPPLHLVETAIPWNHRTGFDRIAALRGRLGEAKMSRCGDTIRFDDASGRLSFRFDPATATLAIHAAARRLNDARERLAAARQLIGGAR